MKQPDARIYIDRKTGEQIGIKHFRTNFILSDSIIEDMAKGVLMAMETSGIKKDQLVGGNEK